MAEELLDSNDKSPTQANNSFTQKELKARTIFFIGLAFLVAGLVLAYFLWMYYPESKSGIHEDFSLFQLDLVLIIAGCLALLAALIKKTIKGQ